MSRGKASGLSLTNKDASIVLGMIARDDRDHDIAAWFGVNQGRRGRKIVRAISCLGPLSHYRV
jgi:hypothetical protein